MVLSSVLGFPRIGIPFSIDRIVFYVDSQLCSGANREIKKAVEAYWGGKSTAKDLIKVSADVKETTWKSLRECKVDLIPRSALVACLGSPPI